MHQRPFEFALAPRRESTSSIPSGLNQVEEPDKALYLYRRAIRLGISVLSSAPCAHWLEDLLIVPIPLTRANPPERYHIARNVVSSRSTPSPRPLPRFNGDPTALIPVHRSQPYQNGLLRQASSG